MFIWTSVFYESLVQDMGEGNGTPLQYSYWKIPWAEEPGRLQSMGSLRVGYDWATSLSLFTFMHWRRKWQPTPVFLPWESQGRGAWWAAIYGVPQSWTRLKRLSSSSRRRRVHGRLTFLLPNYEFRSIDPNGKIPGRIPCICYRELNRH